MFVNLQLHDRGGIRELVSRLKSRFVERVESRFIKKGKRVGESIISRH